MTAPAALEPVAPPKPVIIADEPLYEVVDGQRVELLPMGIYECYVAANIYDALRQFARTHQLGRAWIETLFDLPVVRRKRRPDVAFVSYQRWPRERQLPRQEAWEIAPDLAVEVVSPSNQAEQVLLKVHEYFRAGVELVWVIWPELEEVYVYEGPAQVRIRTRADELDGGTVLPEFRLRVSALFEEGGKGTNGALPSAT